MDRHNHSHNSSPQPDKCPICALFKQQVHNILNENPQILAAVAEERDDIEVELL